MDFLVKLSGDESYGNPLSVLLRIAKKECKKFKLAMINSAGLNKNEFKITGFCSSEYCPIYSAEEMLNNHSDSPIEKGSFIERWMELAEPVTLTEDCCPEFFKHFLDRAKEAILVPIWISGVVERWVILIDYEICSESLDLQKVSLIFNYALSNILRTEQKRQLDKARTWIDEELSEISRLQSLLLPKADVEIPGIKVAFKFKAFKQAGGDYLDLFALPSTPGNLRWGGIIADVTGHGPSAAVEAAMVDAILRTFQGNSETTPAEAANYLNSHFFTRQDRGKFVTAKLFSYNSETRMLRYVSAGHPNGYIKRGKVIHVLDESEGIPIGVLPDFKWEYHEFKMEPHDILFVYTDVVLETRNPKGEEFGETRLLETLKNSPHCPHQLVNHIEEALMDYSGGVNLNDDLTLSAILLEQ